MRRSAEQIMRAYVIERMRRASVQSRDMEAALSRVDESTHPRMSEDAWTESCRLTRGIDPRLWAVMTVYWCGWDERANEKQGAAARGETKFWPHEAGEFGLSVGRDETAVVSQTATQMTFQQACFVAGVSYAEGRRMRYAALMKVSENLAGV